MENKKDLIIEQIQMAFLSPALKKITIDIVEDLTSPTFEEFQDFLNYEIETDYQDFLKWEILKNYTSFENYKQAEFEEIKKEFLKEMKNIFEEV